MERIEIPKSKFLFFLIKAKQNTWAGNKKKIIRNDRSRNYYYKNGSFEYRDQYFGNLMDGGREIVYFQKKPIWIMCYHGGVLREQNVDSSLIFSILRKALLKPNKNFPVRGPLFLKWDKYIYRNKIYGNLYYFYGNEQISFKNKQIYLRAYIGGEIRDKRYCLILVEE